MHLESFVAITQELLASVNRLPWAQFSSGVELERVIGSGLKTQAKILGLHSIKALLGAKVLDLENVARLLKLRTYSRAQVFSYLIFPIQILYN